MWGIRGNYCYVFVADYEYSLVKICIRCVRIFLANVFWVPQLASCAINIKKQIVRTVMTTLLPLLHPMIIFYQSKMGSWCQVLLKTYKVRWWCDSIFVQILLICFLMWFSRTIAARSWPFFHFHLLIVWKIR